jgi:hypothetical protein
VPQAQDFYGAPLSEGATKIEGMTWLHFRDGRAGAPLLCWLPICLPRVVLHTASEPHRETRCDPASTGIVIALQDRAQRRAGRTPTSLGLPHEDSADAGERTYCGVSWARVRQASLLIG